MGGALSSPFGLARVPNPFGLGAGLDCPDPRPGAVGAWQLVGGRLSCPI